MFRRVLGSFHDAAWLPRQFTRDADVVHDVKYGVRLWRRNPAFTLLTVTVLALGIGATTGIFSVIDALLVRQLPYRDPERIVLLFESDSTNRDAIEGVAPANFIDWQQQAQSLDLMAAVEPFGFTYTGGSEPQMIPANLVSRGFFEVFGIEPLYGRTFTSDEFTPGGNQVIVLSYGTWMQRFGGDPGIVGRAIRLNGQPYSVVGVMPATFSPRLLVTFAERGIWAPKVWGEIEPRIRGARFYNAVARLRAGITIEQAQSEFDGMADRLAQQYPRTNAGKAVQLVALRDHLAGGLRPSIAVLAASVFLLLVIAIANSANLLMTRAAARAREIGIRSAIGADRGRLIRQLLAETLLLAGGGSVLGLLVAYGTARLIVLLAPADIPALGSVGINNRVLIFSTALTFLVTILTGIVPAWRGASIRAPDALANAAAGHGGALPSRIGRSRFVIAELALALVLLAGGGLLLRSFMTLLQTTPGFVPEGLATLQIFANSPTRTAPQRAAYFARIIEALRSFPQVREAGAVSVMPFLNTTGGGSVPIVIEGRAEPAPGTEPSALVTLATPGYFAAMRIPVLGGRIFEAHDTADRGAVALVSRAFAERHWADGSPVGQRIRLRVQGTATSAEIVGVVGDVRHDALDRPAAMEIFLPHAQMPSVAMTFVVRVTGDPSNVLPELKAKIHSVEPNQAIYRTDVLEDLVASSLHDRRFMLTLVLAFAILAVVLAATGVYGVMSLVSTQRTREIGLRLALGAERGEILRMVLWQGALLTLTGIGTGLAGALIVGQLLRRFLFGIGPNDVWTLLFVGMSLGTVAAIACLLPALRATRVSPVVALRTD